MLEKELAEEKVDKERATKMMNEKLVVELNEEFKEIDVEYVRTTKERFIRVEGIKYRWSQPHQEYRCAKKACKGRVKTKGKKYYQIKPCEH